MASTHFSRALKSVTDKWNRALSPAYSARPFSDQEDEALMTILREHPKIGWKDLCDRFFPDRHPHRLMNRWAELASDTDILKREGTTFVTTRSKRNSNLSSDDYVVQVVPKRPRK